MNLSTIRLLHKKAKTHEFVSFLYQKDDGSISKRTLRIGIDIAKRMEKQGTPITGRGNWSSKKSYGLRGFLVKHNGKNYVRGTEVGKDSKFKIFDLSKVSELH